MNTEVVIESNVRLPKPKYVQRDHERRQKLFKRYAEAHMSAYVIRPVRYTVRQDGFLTIYDGSDRVLECASERRIETRIRQMKERILSRD